MLKSIIAFIFKVRVLLTLTKTLDFQCSIKRFKDNYLINCLTF